MGLNKDALKMPKCLKKTPLNATFLFLFCLPLPYLKEEEEVRLL